MIQKINQSITTYKNKTDISFKATPDDLLKIAATGSLSPQRRLLLTTTADSCKRFARELPSSFELKLLKDNNIPPDIADKKANGITIEDFIRKLKTNRVECRVRNKSHSEFLSESHVIARILKKHGINNPDVIVIGGK